MRVVLDTNIILSSFSRYSPYRIVFDDFEAGKYELSVSTEILLEYEEKLTEIFSSEVSGLTVGGLMLKKNIIRTEIYYRWNLLITDADDNKFVDCALNSNSNYLVTNDRDYRILSKVDFPPVKVINIDKFISILKSL
ncbi:MAG TPA: putative toxin-antitoxin system toxin component, PIN family [Chitinophagales bacterium]|nr:putative toxin-antitoxin system toxin component, PIN family [Chitinophagales bacterium]